ncbi:MAG: XisI protein [Cyanobacteria bacterium P01_A01_bin.83]
MDTIEECRKKIKKIIADYISVPYSQGDIKAKLIISNDENNYLVITSGWQNKKRVHGCIIHLEIIDDKIWIHRDGTEYGIANDLVDAGIPKDHIVLGFHPTDIRQYTDFAVS